jgi:hypothetical protein
MKSALTIDQSAPTAQIVAADTSIISVISRAAADPNTDVEKLERLLNMYERAQDRNARLAYESAFSAMTPQLPTIDEKGGIKDKSGKVQSTYALWEDINDAIAPILTKHGFTLSFRPGADGDKVTVTAVLSHIDGHSERATMVLPLDMSGSKNAVQGVGSTTSYGKRYLAINMLNITSRAKQDRDRDGQSAFITDEQISQLQDLLIATGSDPIRFCAFMKVQQLAQIPADRFDAALSALNKKVQANG